MPLTNFGAIMSFAEAMEQQDTACYESLAGAGGDSKDLYGPLAREAGKRIKVVQRLRREFATEMILEPIQDFSRTPFEIEPADPGTLDAGQAKDLAQRLETRAILFYGAAADKLAALPDAARDLKRLAKKRQKLLDTLS